MQWCTFGVTKHKRDRNRAKETNRNSTALAPSDCVIFRKMPAPARDSAPDRSHGTRRPFVAGPLGKVSARAPVGRRAVLPSRPAVGRGPQSRLNHPVRSPANRGSATSSYNGLTLLQLGYPAMPRRRALTDVRSMALLALPTDRARPYPTIHSQPGRPGPHRAAPTADHNPLGFAVQLCVLRFPGRLLRPGEAVSRGSVLRRRPTRLDPDRWPTMPSDRRPGTTSSNPVRRLWLSAPSPAGPARVAKWLLPVALATTSGVALAGCCCGGAPLPVPVQLIERLVAAACCSRAPWWRGRSTAASPLGSATHWWRCWRSAPTLRQHPGLTTPGAGGTVGTSGWRPRRPRYHTSVSWRSTPRVLEGVHADRGAHVSGREPGALAQTT